MAIDAYLDSLIVSKQKSLEAIDRKLAEGEAVKAQIRSPLGRDIVEKNLAVRRQRRAVIAAELAELLAANPALPGTGVDQVGPKKPAPKDKP